MPITRHHSGQWLYQFNRVVPGAGRKRANRLLPKGWSKKQADEYDRIESARIYSLAAGVTKSQPLIEDAVLLYLKEHAPTLKNREDLTAALALCQPAYAGKPLSALPDIAKAYAKAHADKLAPATIRNRIAYLRAACRWAWKHHNMGDHDPAERLHLPRVRNARQVYLGRADMLKIVRTMHYPASRAAVKVSFYSGMRISEILRSEPVLAGNAPALRLTDTKNGEPRIVPMHPKIIHLLRGTWPPKVTADTVSHHIKAAMRATGYGYARLHDLRHSAASEMINAGVDLYTVGGVLGHKSAQSTQRYAHLATASLALAVGKIGKNRQPKPQAKAA